jgi:DMSO/TMAO reductase YedYZ molybdopterin-dependent catalytic subunit
LSCIRKLLAHELNDKPLPIKNGAPIRLRIERPLEYEHTKVRRVPPARPELRAHLGRGVRYWKDQGYEWYAGI